MPPWFEPLDAAIGGTADAVTGAVTYPFDLAGDVAGSIGGGVGDAAGGLFGGLFGGLGNWMFQLAALGLAAFVAIKVLA